MTATKATMSLWNRFADFDNFLLAWQRIANVSSRMISDDLGSEIFAFNLHENLHDLVARVNSEDGVYQPQPDNKVYVPKPSTTMRTMSILSTPDLVIYQAMVNVIADTSHPRLVTHENQHVWGNLYAGNGSLWMLRPWKRQYNNFVDQIVKMYKASNSWIASTDIVSFYDTVDHHTLLQFVDKYCGQDSRFLELLKSCLSKWASHSNDTSMSRGIPQGSNASDYLANLYLYEIDQRMIVKGHQYVRYVDDIRILGKDKSTVQRGLIEFDLELKKYGLVAQVGKTSVHQIEDIEKEITRLKFWVTDPSNESTHEDEVSIPRSEQASSVRDFINNSQNVTDEDFLEDEETDTSSQERPSVDDNTSAQSVQNQLYEQFLDAYENLDDPEKGKEANTKITYCLNRLFRRDDLREKTLNLLVKIPWRSEAVTKYLTLFKRDPIIMSGLTDFIRNHDVYYWHRANALEALAQVSAPQYIALICREWIADEQQAWYCKIVATRLLAKVAGQHSFFVESLRREQLKNMEQGIVLRQQLAFAAFSTARSEKKHKALFDIILRSDESTQLRRLAIYLLQQPGCKVSWDAISVNHTVLGEYGDLIETLGISPDVPRPCYILQSVGQLFDVSLPVSDLRQYYGSHYDQASKSLRESVKYFYSSNNDFVRNSHQFAHLTLIAFHQWVFPGSDDPTAMNYSNLYSKSDFKTKTPVGNATWERLGKFRNRVDHPIDRSTRLHSMSITYQETDLLKKELRTALQELYEAWISAPAPAKSTSVSTT